MKSKKIGLSLALAGLMASTSYALPLITGAISFSGSVGSVTLRDGSGGPVGTVAAATFIDFNATSIFVTTAIGSYSGAVPPGALATFTDFLFSPGTSGVSTLWNVLSYPAWLTGATQTSIDRDLSGTYPVLTLKGVGTLVLAGYDPTPSFWTITVTEGTVTAGPVSQAMTAFGFSSTAVPIPDGGSTVILLGSAVLALFGISRKLRFLA